MRTLLKIFSLVAVTFLLLGCEKKEPLGRLTGIRGYHVEFILITEIPNTDGVSRVVFQVNHNGDVINEGSIESDSYGNEDLEDYRVLSASDGSCFAVFYDDENLKSNFVSYFRCKDGIEISSKSEAVIQPEILLQKAEFLFSDHKWVKPIYFPNQKEALLPISPER